MKTLDAVRYQQRLHDLFGRIGEVKDLEMQAQWAKFLCVLSCGFIEVSVRGVLVRVARTRGAPELVNFVEWHLEKFRNPYMRNIVKLVGAFSKSWEKELEAKTSGEIADAVNSLVGNRHLIAHGRDSGVTYTTVSKWHEQAVVLVESLEEVCGV